MASFSKATMSKTTIGKIAVGRIVYERGKPIYPTKDNYERIVIMMKSHSKWWPLSPYYLVNGKGQIMENIWQFSKHYAEVPKSIQTYSLYDPTIIWSHQAENHIDDDGNPNERYYAWRNKGFNNKYAVRYPVGYNDRHKCLCSISESGERMDYIESRKKIYLPIYTELAKQSSLFTTLLNKLKTGKNILICEVDGPRGDDDYYHNKYNTPKGTVVDNTVVVSDFGILEMFLNDDKYPFGHGYCLSWSLLEELDKTK